MLTQSEIASLLLQLLAETRAYRGVKFGCLHLDAIEQIKFAKGLLRVLPEPERRMVETVFVWILATHPTPEAVQ